ncbi:type IV toxin-antitoxin system AbiEi family antitoxin domain-containing protein [Nocardioides sp. TF02-7]|uniref:type IV toxin-antitoxin system AbiEi family antitoxin domain-containing protein n=1 Tax=Nocardioides sp. TF02-7 TaxID=2917724 RepID=UPI001F0626CC|nr:type IV toxin-antitoxin system AbiEi family antitoxin domain-containing protein [Nocardioides sp. TF02-7]UMG93928.1 type IV toxin-antitoxin system AbiEi family antitoxin domain-containing protein [Nocardioides sp. TF02-7]
MTTTRTPPTGPFTYSSIAALGISRHQLRRWVKEGKVRRVLRNVYVAADADVEHDLELRCRAVDLVTPADHVVRDRTAAWLHGIDTLTYGELEVAPDVETCALRGHEPSAREGVDGRTRDLVASDITVLFDVRVTTPLRTALDLSCLLLRRDALAALDAFCRVHGITRRQLEVGLRRYRRRRGVVQARELVALVDPRAESARESWTRLQIHDAGLPPPELQWWTHIDGVPTYRLDLAYPKHRIAVEYDGWDAHERNPEQRANDKSRRAWLRANGWTIIVIRMGDFTGEALDRWIGELRRALRPSYSNVRRMERGSRALALTQ